MDIKQMIAGYPRLPLTPLPTPLEFAPNLTEYLGGPWIYIKRDDLTALAFGGNKTRKLGMEAVAVLEGEMPQSCQGNLLLDHIMGARLIYDPNVTQALEAIRIAAETEGLILCHTYAGKAFAGMIDLIRRGVLTRSDTVVFLHTGGGVGNFAHSELF